MSSEGALPRTDPANVPAGGVRRAGVQHDYPLTYLQREIWFHCQLHAGAPLHRSGVAATIVGTLDRPLFERALQAVVDRQAVLRTAVRASNGVPRQFIAPELAVDLFYEDLSGLDESVRLERLVERFQQIESEDFDLGRAPLWRAALLRFHEREHVLAFFFHHLIVDVFHSGAIVGEIGATYCRFANGDLTPPPPLPLEYRDYAVWLDECQRAGRHDGHDAYWLNQLRASRSDVLIPRDRLAPANRQFVVDGLVRQLDDRLADSLAPLARTCRATPYGLLLATFAIMLGRVTSAREAFVGQPFSTRPPELQDVAGMFANPLPVRIQLDPRRPFRELVGAVRREMDEARRRRECALMDAVRRMVIEGEPDTVAPLRVSMSQMRSIDLQFPGFRIVQTPSVFGATHPYDLWIGVKELSPGIALTFGYATELFERDTAARLATCFETLLEDAVRHPDRAIGDLEMLPASDRHFVIDAWNGTRLPYPGECSVAEVFEGQARRTPDAPAVSAGPDTLSYGELDARANRLAHWLRAQGVGPDTLVPLVTGTSFEMVVGMLGVLKAGGGYVPIEPGTPPLRLRRLLGMAAAPVVLTERSRAGELCAVADVAGRILCLDDEWGLVAGEPPSAPAPKAIALSTAYVTFTSGPTAAPTGVVVPHRAVVRLALNANEIELGGGDTVLQHSSVAWDASTLEVWGALLNGARLVLVPQSSVPDAEALAGVLRTERITVLVLTPAVFNQAIDRVPEALAGLKTLIVRGEQASVPHFRRASEELAGTRVINAYGPTENTTVSTWGRVERVRADAPTIRVGRALANSTVYVLDENLRSMPIKVKGEIYVGGDGLARGYLDRPAATAERFVPNPFASGERLYRTGDWGRWHPDGTLELLGRTDRQVTVRGYRVEPGEVEAVLREHPGVREAAVVPLESTGSTQLVAYVVTDGQEPAPALGDHLAEHLPDHLRPVNCFVVDALPLTAAGDIDRRKLAAGAASAGGAPIELDTDLERHIAAVWRDVLGIARIAADDNFFEIGGDSIACVRIAARLRERGLPLRERDFFDHQTVGTLAACLRQRALVATAAPVATIFDSRLTAAVDDDELVGLLAGEGDL